MIRDKSVGSRLFNFTNTAITNNRSVNNGTAFYSRFR